MSAASPLDDARALMQRMPEFDVGGGEAVEALFRGNGVGGSALARIAARVARITGARPSVSRPSLALFAGTHGIARNGISQRKLDATLSVLSACSAGEAPVNHLCAANMIGLKVYDLALHMATGDIARANAMDERTTAATIAFGMEAIAGGADCLLLASIPTTGDETVAAALLCSFHGGDPGEWLPDDDDFRPRRIDLIGQALARTLPKDPLLRLAALGGREFAAMAGAILAARMERKPVILEGASALAAASVLAAIDPSAIGHCLLADAPDGAARRAAESLGLGPLVVSGVAAGEGTAAALAVSVLRDALALHAGFAAHGRHGHSH